MNFRNCTTTGRTQAAIIEEWVREFIAKPHEDLGVEGRAVCPVVPASLRHQKLYIQSSHIEPTFNNFCTLLRTEKGKFLERIRTTTEHPELLDSMIALEQCFSQDHSIVMDAVHATVKTEFMADGLMVGQLHPYNETPGLHNPAFRPFKAPGFCFTMRQMITSDHQFIGKNLAGPAVKMAAQSFLRRFGDVVPDAVRLRLEAL